MVQSGVSFEAAIGAAMALTRDIELAAATVAHLRAPMVGGAHPAIESRLAELAQIAVPGIAEATPEQKQTVAGILATIFRQAADLMENPAKEPGWTYSDPVVLQATGRASMSVAAVLAQVAPTLGDLGERLASGGSFVDVGTGVGWLSVAAAGAWPQARIVGIDIYPTALELARQNVAGVGLGERIELREEDVCKLAGEHDLVWLPGPFLPHGIVGEALAATYAALKSGGWVAFGLYGGPPEPVMQQLADLRTIRSGGHPWTRDEAVAAMEAAGFAEVVEVDRTWNAPVRLVVGRRP